MKIVQTISFKDENGNPQTIKSGGELSIKEHKAQGEGDKWYWDINYLNGDIWRIFNPESVWYSEE